MIINVLEIEENDDGGATVVLEFDDEAVHFLVESGFNSILAKAIEQCSKEKEDGR